MRRAERLVFVALLATIAPPALVTAADPGIAPATTCADAIRGELRGVAADATYEACLDLSASAEVHGGVTIRAGTTIRLQSGFRVARGARLVLEVDDRLARGEEVLAGARPPGEPSATRNNRAPLSPLGGFPSAATPQLASSFLTQILGLQNAKGSAPGSSEGDLTILFSQQEVSGEVQLASSSASADLVRPSLVTILGLDAGAEVEVMAVSRRWTKRAYTAFSTIRETLFDEDQDGIVELEVPGDIPLHSVWTAVDLSSGRYGVQSAGVRLLPVSRSAARFDVDRGELELPGRSMEVLWARPGVGAWSADLVDGSLDDVDAEQNATVRGRLDDLLLARRGRPDPLPGGPRRFDVVITIDRQELRTGVYVVRGEGSR